RAGRREGAHDRLLLVGRVLERLRRRLLLLRPHDGGKEERAHGKKPCNRDAPSHAAILQDEASPPPTLRSGKETRRNSLLAARGDGGDHAEVVAREGALVLFVEA